MERSVYRNLCISIYKLRRTSKFKVIQISHLQYIYVPFRNSEVCLVVFQPFNSKVLRFCLVGWAWFCFEKRYLIILFGLFRNFALKSKLNSLSNSRLKLYICTILIKNLSLMQSHYCKNVLCEYIIEVSLRSFNIQLLHYRLAFKNLPADKVETHFKEDFSKLSTLA